MTAIIQHEPEDPEAALAALVLPPELDEAWPSAPEPARRESWLRQHGLEAGLLGGVLLLSAGLRLVSLDREGFGNTYYAAAVWSMLHNWHAFLFAAFDAGGFVSVDKPPVGLWVQAASATLFGFSGVSLLLPQALAGIASVAVVWWLVRRAFGAWAGLAAAAVLAVTPINVVTDRNNTMDSQLILLLLLAAWALSRAAESGRLRPLLLSAALVGVGFNVKMLQAYPVVPAFALAYGLLAPVPWRSRLARLLLAAVVLLGVSLSWSAMVDLTPASLRPYVGSSGSNSALSLALGYNGLSRITLAIAQHVPALSFLGEAIDLNVAPAFAPGIGTPSLHRLFTSTLGGQASWLLGLALAGLVAGAWQAARPFDAGADGQAGVRKQRVAVVVWGGWLLTWGAIFSFARFYHLYYLAMLGPGVAALAGIGVWLLWRAYHAREIPGAVWLLPAGLVGSALVQRTFLVGVGGWLAWLPVLLLGGVLAAAIVLMVAWVWSSAPRGWATAAVSLGLAALLVAPLGWSAVSVQDGNGGEWLPQAGPPLRFGGPTGFRGGLGSVQAAPGPRPGRGGPAFGNGGGRVFPAPNGGAQPGAIGRTGFGVGGGALTFAGPRWNPLDPGLLWYLQANQGTTRYLVATESSSYASVFILATGQPAMALGGYQAWDSILRPSDLPRLIVDGTVRYFYLAAGGGGRGQSQVATGPLAAWVSGHCTAVPASDWSSAASTGRAGIGTQGRLLYDCAGATE